MRTLSLVRDFLTVVAVSHVNVFQGEAGVSEP